MDGSCIDLLVPGQSRVRELKREIGTLRALLYLDLELFLDGTEDALPDDAILGPAESLVMFMLIRPAGHFELRALQLLFRSTAGDSWDSNAGWASTTSSATPALGAGWHGVQLSGGRVTRLLLDDNNLAGPLPSEVQALGCLSVLCLQHNEINGQIPWEFGQLAALEHLLLNDNELEGRIPQELGQLPVLKRLALHNNQIVGRVPSSLGLLSALTHLQLQSNWLTGPIPAELGRLSSLGQLALYNNHLGASIPAELGQLRSLTHLLLQGNHLSGASKLLYHIMLFDCD